MVFHRHLLNRARHLEHLRLSNFKTIYMWRGKTATWFVLTPCCTGTGNSECDNVYPLLKINCKSSNMKQYSIFIINMITIAMNFLLNIVLNITFLAFVSQHSLGLLKMLRHCFLQTNKQGRSFPLTSIQLKLLLGNHLMQKSAWNKSLGILTKRLFNINEVPKGQYFEN